jgi:aspartate 1-decarboxylase
MASILAARCFNSSGESGIPRGFFLRKRNADMNGIRYTTTLMASAALLLAVAQGADGAAYSGKIKSVSKDRLVLTVKDKEVTVRLDKETKITIDGKQAKPADLKAGLQAAVKAKKVGVRMVAVSIAARTAKTAFRPVALAASYRGTIKKIDRKGKTIDVFDPADKKTTAFAVRKDTKVTLDGRVAKFADLKEGFSVEVTAKKEGKKLVATAVVARKKNL